MLRNSKIYPFLKMILKVVVLLIIFLILAIPFKVLSIIPGFTDIRPVSLLQPVYGIFFGIPGCVAFAIGNLIGDIVSNSLKWSSIAGFVANFAGPFLFYLFFVLISKETFSLKKGKQFLLMIAVIVLSAAAQAVIITPAVVLVYPEVSGFVFATTVMINGLTFPILLGIPLIILMQEELGFKPLSPPVKIKKIKER